MRTTERAKEAALLTASGGAEGGLKSPAGMGSTALLEGKPHRGCGSGPCWVVDLCCQKPRPVGASLGLIGPQLSTVL